MPIPLRLRSRMIWKICCFARTSIPRVGSSSSITAGLCVQPVPEHDLLLVPAAQRRYRGLRVGDAMIEASSIRRRTTSRSRARVGDAAARDSVEAGQADIGPGAEDLDQPFLLPFLRRKGHPQSVSSVTGDAGRTTLPADHDLPGVARSAPKSARSNSVRPEPSNPAMPRISPAMEREGDLFERPGRLRPRTCRTGSRPPEVCRADLLGHLSEHHPDDALRGSHQRSATVPTQLAVAQNGHRVGDPAEFLEPVGDVEDHHPLRGERAEEGEQTVGLMLRQRGGRLVQHQHRGLVRHRLGDLHHLLLGDAEASGGLAARRARVRAGRGSVVRWRRSAPSRSGSRRSLRPGSRPRRMFSATVSSGTRLSSW